LFQGLGVDAGTGIDRGEDAASVGLIARVALRRDFIRLIVFIQGRYDGENTLLSIADGNAVAVVGL